MLQWTAKVGIVWWIPCLFYDVLFYGSFEICEDFAVLLDWCQCWSLCHFWLAVELQEPWDSSKSSTEETHRNSSTGIKRFVSRCITFAAAFQCLLYIHIQGSWGSNMFWFSDNWCLLPIPKSTDNHSRSVSSESDVKSQNIKNNSVNASGITLSFRTNGSGAMGLSIYWGASEVPRWKMMENARSDKVWQNYNISPS